MKRTRSQAEINQRRESAKKRQRQRDVARRVGILKPVQTRTYVPRSLGNAMAATENKYYDLSVTHSITTPTSAWSVNERAEPGSVRSLFGPVTGDDIFNREGRKVVVKSIRIRGHISVSAQSAQTAADNATYIRMVLVLDKQTNGTQMDPGNLLSSGSAPNIDALTSTASFGRYQILRDKKIVIGQPNMVWNGATIFQGGAVRPFKLKYNWPNGLVVHYNATNSGDIPDTIDNSLHLICGCTNLQLAPQLVYQSRVVFVG